MTSELGGSDALARIPAQPIAMKSACPIMGLVDQNNHRCNDNLPGITPQNAKLEIEDKLRSPSRESTGLFIVRDVFVGLASIPFLVSAEHAALGEFVP